MKKLLEYNAFGLVEISRKEITATIVAYADGKKVRRCYGYEYEDDVNGIGDKTVNIAFAAWIEDDKPSRITVLDIENDPDLPPTNEMPEINKVVAGAINIIKAAISN